jgi:hypothetical protein
MDLSKINWKSGKIRYSATFVKWDLEKSLSSQRDWLQEDILLVRYKNVVSLGLGWYPAYKLSGRFTLSVVKSFDWENPIFEIKFRKLGSLMKNLNYAIQIAHDVANHKIDIYCKPDTATPTKYRKPKRGGLETLEQIY